MLGDEDPVRFKGVGMTLLPTTLTSGPRKGEVNQNQQLSLFITQTYYRRYFSKPKTGCVSMTLHTPSMSCVDSLGLSVLPLLT